MGARLPREIQVIGIQAENVYVTFLTSSPDRLLRHCLVQWSGEDAALRRLGAKPAAGGKPQAAAEEAVPWSPVSGLLLTD